MYYLDALEILHLNKDCSLDDIRRAYRKAAKINHPDMGGSQDAMQIINDAKVTLEKWIEVNKPADNNRNARDTTSNSSKPRNEANTTFSDNIWKWNKHEGYSKYSRGPFADEFMGDTKFKEKERCGYCNDTTIGCKYAWTLAYTSDFELLNNVIKTNLSNIVSDLKKAKVIESGILIIIALILSTGLVIYSNLIGKVNTILFIGLISALLLCRIIGIYKSNRIGTDKIKLDIKNNSSGTFVKVRYKDIDYGTYRISGPGFNIKERASSIMYSWREALINGPSAFTIDECGNKREIECDESDKYKFMQFNEKCIIANLNPDTTLIIHPGLFIYVTNKDVRVETMETTEMDMRPGDNDCNIRILDIAHASGIKTTIYFKIPIQYWRNLI